MAEVGDGVVKQGGSKKYKGVLWPLPRVLETEVLLGIVHLGDRGRHISPPTALSHWSKLRPLDLSPLHFQLAHVWVPCVMDMSWDMW